MRFVNRLERDRRRFAYDHLHMVLYAESGHYGTPSRSLFGAIAELENGTRAASVWRRNRLVATYTPEGGVRYYG